MPDFAAAQAHGPITEIFPDLFLVTGTFAFAPLLSIPRNMAIIRTGNELTLVNAVRLSAQGEAELAKLGEVKRLLRIGAFHSLDDPYFVHRYQPQFWAPPGTRHNGGIAHQHDLVAGAVPVPGCEVFAFSQGRRSEVALLLQRDGGILLTCDSYQHWTSFDGCSLLGKLMMRLMGFGPTLIGGPWVKEMGPAVRQDFDRLRQVPFQHLVPAHGAVLRDTARQGLDTAIAHRFGAAAAG